MNKGDKVIVIKHWVKQLIGLEGFVNNIDLESTQPYTIIATNYGPYIKSHLTGKTKKVFAWVPNNHISVKLEQIEKYGTK